MVGVGLPALATLALNTPAIAVPVLPGHFDITNGTTSSARPELDGVVIADTLRSFKFKDGQGGFITGQIQDRVVRETSAGTLDFYTRVIMASTSSSAASVHQFSRTNFAAYTTDVDYTTDGLGDKGTTFIGRAGNGSSLAYTLAGSLNPGESSYFILTKTNATSFDARGTTVLNYTEANTAKLTTYEPSGVALASYAVTDLGPLDPGMESTNGYINSRGQVSFTMSQSPFTTAEVALWSPSAPNALDGTVVTLPMLANAVSSVTGQINTNGQITGTCYYANGLTDAFLWTPSVKNGAVGRIENLGTLPGGTYSEGYGLNDAGEVSGASDYQGAPTGVNGLPYANATIWKAGKPTILPTGGYGIGYAINRSGQVAAYGEFAGGTYQGCLWTPSSPDGTSGTVTSISQEGSAYAGSGVAFSLNDAGVTVGYYFNGTTDNGFIWNGSTVIDLGANNNLSGINDANQGVGTDDGDVALLYSQGVLRDLNGFLPAASGFMLWGYSINNVGQIVAETNTYEAVLLTPVQISAISPVRRPLAAFTLTLKGMGFEPGAVVLWNGVSLNLVSATSTQIVATVTAAEATATGPVNVLVSNPNGTVGIKLY
jgi:hypothetical protein